MPKIRLPRSPCAARLDTIIAKLEKITMALSDIVAADAALKAELDVIATGVHTIVAQNKALADQLAAAIAAQDPAQLQAALDSANANLAEAQQIAALLPAPPAPTA